MLVCGRARYEFCARTLAAATVSTMMPNVDGWLLVTVQDLLAGCMSAGVQSIVKGRHDAASLLQLYVRATRLYDAEPKPICHTRL